jgi:hypothetical protein
VWEDGTIKFERVDNDGIDVDVRILSITCSFANFEVDGEIFKDKCHDNVFGLAVALVLCEQRRKLEKTAEDLSFPVVSHQWNAEAYVECPLKHISHTFLACDDSSSCWSKPRQECTAALTPLPPSFDCKDGLRRVPYSLVCDSNVDCVDASDENFCRHQRCPHGRVQCGLGQVCSSIHRNKSIQS